MKKIFYGFSNSSDGNMAFSSKDSYEMVIKNRKNFLDRLDLSACRLVTVNQVHGCNIHVVTLNNSSDQNRIEADAIITNLGNTAIGVMTADCLPVIIYSKLQKGVGVIHAGRVGSHLSISSVVLNFFLKRFETTPSDINVILGPCIGKCCYEVGAKELEPLIQLKNEFSEIASSKGNDKWMLDIREVNKIQILKTGIPEKNIISINTCTCCSNEYFSYRKNKTFDRFMTLVSMLTT
jgi:YfiH family protein